MRDRRATRFSRPLALAAISALSVALSAVAIIFLLTAPGVPGEPGRTLGTGRFDVSLIAVLIIALGAILTGASVAAFLQGAFTSYGGGRPGDLGVGFQRHVVTFAWIVGSVTASYTVARIAELLINALLTSG